MLVFGILVFHMAAALSFNILNGAGLDNFLYISEGDLPAIKRLVTRPEIAGVQIVYSWKLLEREKDQYDFAPIERDLRVLRQDHKRLFIQIQDRFFTPNAKNIPAYLMTDPEYGGGLVAQKDNPGEGKAQVWGWVALQWNPNVRHRYQKLLQALAKRFDGEVYGINLPETSVDIDMKADKTGFTCDNYFNAEIENLGMARQAFQKSLVVQYVNFWPCEWDNDHGYMSRTFEFAARNGIGLGGPDIVPYKRAQMHNSYPFFAKYKDKLRVVAMAVQEPTLTYKNQKTGKPFTRNEFEEFGRDYLGAKIIFWSASAQIW